MSSPVVSVVIPTHNRASLLPRAIDSVVSQTFSDWEIVLIDDGSTDDTSSLVKDYAARLKDRLVYIRQRQRGSSAARNRGIDAVRGKFVAFLDSDDEFAPTKLKRQLALFEKRRDLGFVYSDFSFIDLDGVKHDSAFGAKFPIARRVPCETVAPGLWMCTGSVFDTLLEGYFIATIVGMVRRDVLGTRIRFDESLSYAEEWLFFLHVARAAKAGFVDEPLSIHHYTAGSLARTATHANLVRFRDALAAIRRQFPDLSTAQKRIVRGKLADTTRQLGYHALKNERPTDALRCFSEAFRTRPGLRAARELLQSAVLHLGPAGVAHPRLSPAR